MPPSKPQTVDDYLDELPDDRAQVVRKLRSVIRKHLPKGYQETLNWGMISYEVPLKRYPTTYNGQPLGYVALAAQKNHFALYMMSVYMDPAEQRWLADEFDRAGKKLDMGKSCIRFKSPDDLPLDAIGKLVAGTPPDEYIRRYEASRKTARRK